jgi:hypothetical protein
VPGDVGVGPCIVSVPVCLSTGLFPATVFRNIENETGGSEGVSAFL